MFGRQAILPIDLVYGTRSGQAPVTEYAKSTKNALDEAYQLVREKLDAAHCHQEVHYDKKVHDKLYIVGDLVRLFSSVVPSGQPRKLYHPWSGPYRVIAKLSETDYRVKKITGRKTIRIVHFNWFKRCDPATRFENLPPHSSSTPNIPVHLQAIPSPCTALPC